MNELDEMWAKMLSQALEKAKASGRQDVADYLTLKATNDAIRQTGTAWLFDTMLAIVGDANRNKSGISTERTNPHNFSYRGANLVGSRLRMRYGVRCLTIEAGWTRTPADGFMRGSALAFAKITHLGMTKQNVELQLQKSEGIPAWHLLREEKPANHFQTEALRGHFRIFLGG